ncbi:MAG: hypothetical protein ACR2PL_10245 [Dehalococcoidia bacterium]
MALREVFGDLSLWLTLHEESYCILGAEGATAGIGLLPPLFHWSSASRSTLGLLESTSLCLLTIPQQLDHPLDLSDIQTRFELVVRSFGQDDALRRRLVDEIRAWSSAGRPSSQDLRIRVYRHETGYVAAPDEILLGKRWTQLVLSWR